MPQSRRKPSSKRPRMPSEKTQRRRLNQEISALRERLREAKELQVDRQSGGQLLEEVRNRLKLELEKAQDKVEEIERAIHEIDEVNLPEEVE